MKRPIKFTPVMLASILMLSSCQMRQHFEEQYKELSDACRKSGGVPVADINSIGDRFYNRCEYFPEKKQ